MKEDFVGVVRQVVDSQVMQEATLAFDKEGNEMVLNWVAWVVGRKAVD